MASHGLTIDPAAGAEPGPADEADTQGHSLADTYVARELARGREREIQQGLKAREHALAAQAARDKVKGPQQEPATHRGASWLSLRRAGAAK